MSEPSSNAKLPDGRGRAVLSLIILAAIFIAQYVLFRDYVLGKVAPYYPPNHDQAAYLREAYYILENIRERGVTALFKEFVSPGAAQGKLLTTQANVLFMLAGPSRLNALLPNFLYFLALQASIFYLLKKVTGQYAISFVALGLILMLAYPFYGVGDLFDFRIDFQAFCLYGIFVSAIVASNAFLSNRWSIIATALGFLLALLRHVALGYIGGVYLVMLVLLLFLYLVSRDGARKKNTLRRIRNVVLSGLAILGATLPFLWASRATIYNYYGVGHFLGKEKEIRSPGETIGTNVAFYLQRLYEHIGVKTVYIITAFLVIGVLLLLYSKLRGHADKAMEEAGGFFSLENFVFLAIAAITPFLVLIVDMNKSPVVGAVMVTPVMLFCLLAFSRGTSRAPSRTAMAALCVVAVVFMALGLKSQYARYKTALPPDKRASLEDITKISLEIGEYCLKNSITDPAISFDTMRDYMTDGSMTIINYEARQKLLRFKVTLANSIFDISMEDAAAKLGKSDIAVFSPDATIGSGYPFDKSMDAMRPELLSLIERDFLKLKEFRIYNRTYYLFVKPAKKI